MIRGGWGLGWTNQKDVKISTTHSFVQGKACFVTKFMFDSCLLDDIYVFPKKWLITLRNELNKELREV